MAFQIGAKPDSSFDDPIGMLKDCHRRIESFRAAFFGHEIVDRLGGYGNDQENEETKRQVHQSP